MTEQDRRTERCQSGRSGRSRKPLCPVRGTVGSNPTLSASYTVQATESLGSAEINSLLTAPVVHKGWVTMAVTMNLQRHSKSGVWRYRRRVPQECQSAIGKTWIIESLGTKDRGKAKLAVLAVHAYWEAQFADAKNGTYQTEGERRISGLLSEWQNELFMVGTNPDAKWTPPFHDVHEIEQSIDECGKVVSGAGAVREPDASRR